MKEEDKGKVVEELGMNETEDLGMYLGMPTLTSRVTRETFGHLCEKIDRRLAGWKTKFLSLAGRITLAKSTLSTIGIYSMQTAKLPRSTCDDIDKKTRRFIWGGNDESRKIHLLSWETLQKDRDNGGISIRSARQINAAFLTKLGWRVLTEPNALWSRVLRSKYCKGRCDLDMFEPVAGSSNVWKGITDNACWLKEGAATAIGNGKSTCFWDHKWAMEPPLRHVCTSEIPAHLEEAKVEDMWEEGQGWKWSEFADYLPATALMRIASHELREDTSLGDLLYWREGKQGKFSIKHVLKLMRSEELNEDQVDWNMVWKAPVQQRIRVFLWLVLHDRVLCNSNRLKRHLTDDPRCPRCHGNEETLLHLLRNCPAARDIWRHVGGTSRSNSFTGTFKHGL